MNQPCAGSPDRAAAGHASTGRVDVLIVGGGIVGAVMAGLLLARKLAAKKNSLGRMGKPEELANATVFLCSERASYVTGAAWSVDGGTVPIII